MKLTTALLIFISATLVIGQLSDPFESSSTGFGEEPSHEFVIGWSVWFSRVLLPQTGRVALAGTFELTTGGGRLEITSSSYTSGGFGEGVAIGLVDFYDNDLANILAEPERLLALDFTAADNGGPTVHVQKIYLNSGPSWVFNLRSVLLNDTVNITQTYQPSVTNVTYIPLLATTPRPHMSSVKHCAASNCTTIAMPPTYASGTSFSHFVKLPPTHGEYIIYVVQTTDISTEYQTAKIDIGTQTPIITYAVV